jgi:hypothetical protein
MAEVGLLVVVAGTQQLLLEQELAATEEVD